VLLDKGIIDIDCANCLNGRLVDDSDDDECNEADEKPCCFPGVVSRQHREGKLRWVVADDSRREAAASDKPRRDDEM